MDTLSGSTLGAGNGPAGVCNTADAVSQGHYTLLSQFHRPQHGTSLEAAFADSIGPAPAVCSLQMHPRK